MSIGRTLLALLLIVAAAFIGSAKYRMRGAVGQSAEPGKQKSSGKQGEAQTERPEEIVSFVNNVRSAPPEFAADLLLRVAESGKLTDQDWKQELIEEAFRLAPSVQQPVKRVTLPSNPTDTRAGFLASALELKLDALSLQCRAVSAMLAVNKQKARELFTQIQKPKLVPLTCEDASVYDASDFYTTLKAIAETTFSQKEVKRGEPIRLAEYHISQMVSPTEVVPVIELISSLKVAAPEREALLYAFSKTLGSISDDDRSFTASLYKVDRSMKKLITECSQQRLSLHELLRAYRAYLIRHFSAARCADGHLISSKATQAAAVNSFNNDLRLTSEKNVAEIVADDIKPSKVEGSMRTHMHWQSPKASALLMKIKKLRFGSGNTPLTTAERESLDWQANMDAFLKDLADWRKDDEESEEDYFHQKCVLLRTLIELIPKQAAREHVVRAYVEFLNSFDLNRGSRVEWLWQAKFLFKDSVRFDGPNNPTPSYVIKRTDMLPVVEMTKSPILYLYLQAEKILT
jgi:hypothetical protein